MDPSEHQGTTILNLPLVKVIDGDTIRVQLNDKEESLRLVCLDTEESQRGGGKPVTPAGKLASAWAKQFFDADEAGVPTQDVLVDIEFDTNDPVEDCLKKHRGNYGRLICYAYRNDQNYNLSAVRAGWSPYFVKYGRSRLYHQQFLQAEAEAQSQGMAIWDPETNAGGDRRDYEALISWWGLRDSIIQDFRTRGQAAGVLSVRLDYETLHQSAQMGSAAIVFCDLQAGINTWAGNGALIYAGSVAQKFNLWIPDRDSESAQAILRLIETRYAQRGRSYVYVSGVVSRYPNHPDGTPQMVLTQARQLSDSVE